MAVGFDPIPRKELYLDVITGGDSELPEPLTREEIYLAKIAGMAVDIPEPLTRYEQYLYAIANGDTLTLNPIPRLEMYLAKACGQDIDVPEPITREEKYWFDYINGGRWETLEYTGAVPVEIYAAGEPLIELIISGNMSQSGTPSPSSIVMPQECGERTGNLLNPATIESGYNVDSSGNLVPLASRSATTTPVDVTGVDNIVLSYSSSGGGVMSFIYALYSGSTLVYRKASNYSGDVINVSGGDAIYFCWYRTGTVESTDVINPMVNSGSTALPYSPYGYKLDISSGGENLAPTATYTNTQTDTQTAFRPVIQLRKNNTNVFTKSYSNISSSGTYSFSFAVSDDIDEIRLIHNGSQRNLYPVDVLGTFAFGDYVLSASFTSANPSMVDGLALENIMLNLGSTAKPYSPYNRSKTPVYLGEVETTRQIRQLVFDGTENWSLWSSGQPDVERYYFKWGKVTPSNYGLICTHFPFINADGNFEHTRLGGSSREDYIIYVSKTIAPTLADFKAWLAAQYAAGTPVCVWYVLATPTTGIVNEPLRKIGNYADSLSVPEGVSIPTIEGENVVDVETTLKPSEIYLKYKGRSSS